MYLRSFFDEVFEPHPCASCTDSNALDFEVRMAFQPIVDADTRTVYAYEALVRGANGEGAGAIISRVSEQQLYRFDQTCRVKAIETAARLGMHERLSINFIPNAVYHPATCIRLTLEAARRCDFDTARLIFEVTETERIRDTAHVVNIIRDYQQRGFLTAIDDFGSGYAGLTLLAEFQPDIVKLDMGLIRGIDQDLPRQAIATGILSTCRALGCQVLAEGVETVGEYRFLRGMGVSLFQGYLFARPELEALPTVAPSTWAMLEAEDGLEVPPGGDHAALVR